MRKWHCALNMLLQHSFSLFIVGLDQNRFQMRWWEVLLVMAQGLYAPRRSWCGWSVFILARNTSGNCVIPEVNFFGLQKLMLLVMAWLKYLRKC